MITTMRNIAPAIDFGAGRTAQQVPAGQPVLVWLQTLYNRQEYDFVLQCSGSVNKVSDYEYIVTFATPGTYAIQLIVSTIGKTKSLASNILELVVTE